LEKKRKFALLLHFAIVFRKKIYFVENVIEFDGMRTSEVWIISVLNWQVPGTSHPCFPAALSGYFCPIFWQFLVFPAYCFFLLIYYHL